MTTPDGTKPAVFGAETWPDLRARLSEALEREPREPTRIATLRPLDGIRANAREAQALADLAYDWSSPRARLAREEVAEIARYILRAPPDAPVAFTESGTESVFLALKSAREWAKVAGKGGVSGGGRPHIVIPRSAHACFDKAAHFLGLTVTRTDLDADRRANPEAMAAAIRPETILLAASAPTDCHGICDPVPRIAALAEAHGLWCHVDACLGAFLVPFLRAEGADLPEFEFSLSGVRSISADPHKYGYAPTGISLLALRGAEDRSHLAFEFSGWDGPPLSATERFAGTRSTAGLIGAWATFRQLGEEGYRQRARCVREHMTLFAAMIEATPGWRLLSRPEAGLVHFAPESGDMALASAALRAMGHKFNETADPPGVVVCIGPEHDPADLPAYRAGLEAAIAPD
ncbi:MAG: aminotransferase class V-fold PLP-dependent enzyme [Proteobacteria bacterium]|nr:aminotransferase class V-fold PLP-dependent enzyme [Pseudomonadota bacterium]MDA1204669.1 aminotransferase class V-fold PLP-dependent enzyme [Verrucomicrobiota bacterium]